MENISKILKSIKAIYETRINLHVDRIETIEINMFNNIYRKLKIL